MLRLLIAALLVAPSISAQARPLAVVNGQIIDMRSEHPYRATLFIRAGRIERVAAPVGAGQRSIEHLTSLAPACSATGAALADEAARSLDSVRALDFTRDSTLRPRVIAALGPYYEKSRSRALDACNVGQGIPPLARALREGGAWVTPTLILAASSLIENTHIEDSLRALLPTWAAGMTRVRPPTADDSARAVARLERMLAMMRELRRGGVRMLIGSDAPNPGSLPGIGLHRELELFVNAGYTPFEALRIATRDAAEFAGALDSVGTIAAGRLADLVLLGANPLDDIRNTRRIRAVLLQGRALRLSESAR